MENESIALPLGKQVLLRGHFDAPVTLEHARALSSGYECRVRLSDGSLQEAVISREGVIAEKDWAFIALCEDGSLWIYHG